MCATSCRRQCAIGGHSRCRPTRDIGAQRQAWRTTSTTTMSFALLHFDRKAAGNRKSGSAGRIGRPEVVGRFYYHSTINFQHSSEEVRCFPFNPDQDEEQSARRGGTGSTCANSRPGYTRAWARIRAFGASS